MLGRYFRQAWLVLILSLAFGGALAGVQVAVGDRIAENKRNETLSQIPLLVPGSESAAERVLAERQVYEAVGEGTRRGWVVPASGQGFADRIELLVGTDARAETITGIYILDQKETPGLGNKIIESRWRDQFRGKSTTSTLGLTGLAPAGTQPIDGLTGATISSQAVCDIINRTLQSVRSDLVEAAP